VALPQPERHDAFVEENESPLANLSEHTAMTAVYLQTIAGTVLAAFQTSPPHQGEFIGIYYRM